MSFVLIKGTVCFVLFCWFFYTIKLDYPPTTLPLNFPEYDPKAFRKTAANVQLMPNIETLQLAHNRACLAVYYLFLTDKVKTLQFSRPESSFTFPLLSFIILFFKHHNINKNYPICGSQPTLSFSVLQTTICVLAITQPACAVDLLH